LSYLFFVTIFFSSFFLVFFMNMSPPPPPQSIPSGPFQFFSKICRDICNSRCTTGINNTGGKFVTGFNDTGGKLPLVSTTLTANNGNNIGLQIPESELEGKNLYIC
jgi:hypothetical protein